MASQREIFDKNVFSRKMHECLTLQYGWHFTPRLVVKLVDKFPARSGEFWPPRQKVKVMGDGYAFITQEEGRFIVSMYDEEDDLIELGDFEYAEDAIACLRKHKPSTPGRDRAAAHYLQLLKDRGQA
eukprot:g34201.t1